MPDDKCPKCGEPLEVITDRADRIFAAFPHNPEICIANFQAQLAAVTAERDDYKRRAEVAESKVARLKKRINKMREGIKIYANLCALDRKNEKNECIKYKAEAEANNE